MEIQPPFTDLDIRTQDSGFYRDHSLAIALLSKGATIALVLWALVWPGTADRILGLAKWGLLETFNAFYVLIVAGFLGFLLVIALWPATGRRVMGSADEKPEFSNFSWFAMMFGAGLGVGLMVFATAEPLGLWGSNPVIVGTEVTGYSPAAVESGFRYTFLHYGFHAWGIYVVTGLALAYYAYTRDMPLTIRTALTPLLGERVNGIAGHIVDVLGVVATILGVSVTIGFGVSQFIDGVYSVTGIQWIMDVTGDTPAPSKVGLMAGLLTIMSLSIISAVTGVGRGVKYLSNLNLVLSAILLITFIVFGSFAFSLQTYGSALVDYTTHLLPLSFEAYTPVSVEAYRAELPAIAAPHAEQLLAAAADPYGTFKSFQSSLEGGTVQLSPDVLQSAYVAATTERLFNWQAGWSAFYWAWWVAFSPFVGLFLARISKGRSVREFIIGCVIAPSLVCFAWMTILGGTAIDLELSKEAGGSIIEASNTAKLFVTLSFMLDGGWLIAISGMCVLLILTFLVTSADSGILVMNTIMSGGSAETGIRHRISWGIILTAVIGTLLLAGDGGIQALSNAMIIGALPFAMVMVLMCVALAKALYRDRLREKHGTAS